MAISDALIELERAKALFETKDYTSAAQIFAELVNAEPDVAIYHAWLARALQGHGNPKFAVHAAERAIELDSKCAMAYFARANIRRDQHDLDGAIADYNAALRIDPDDARFYHNRGRTFYDKGDLDAAIRDYTSAIHINLKAADPYVARGLARYNKGDLTGAITDYNSALRIDPDNIFALINRGNARYDKGDLNGAIADYTDALRLDPDHAIAYNNRGNIRRSKGDLDSAINDYSAAVRIDPQHPDAYANRKIARQMLGDVEGALADQARVYQLSPKTVISAAGDKYQPLYTAVHQHFIGVLMPQIQRRGERLIEYYPCALLWDRQESIRRRMDGSICNVRTGSHGTGYVCLTDKSIHLMVSGALTAQFPLYRGSGMGSLLSHALREVDETQPQKTDRLWSIEWQSIQSVQAAADSRLNQRIIQIAGSSAWDIYQPLGGSFDEVLIALNMGVAGKLDRIWSDDPFDTAPTEARLSRRAVTDLLKKLEDLHHAGVLSESEFEEKQKSLLNRLG